MKKGKRGLTIPPGYTEEDVMSIIDKVVRSLASQFSFGYFDEDDMYQEGFIFAMEALPRVNHKRGDLEPFLRTHVRNRFLNLIRKKLYRYESPCANCKTKCKYIENISECPRHNAWTMRNVAKRSLTESSEVDVNVENQYLHTNDASYIAERSEILSLIETSMPVALRSDYRRLVEGGELTPVRRAEVQSAIQMILNVLNQDCEAKA